MYYPMLYHIRLSCIVLYCVIYTVLKFVMLLSAVSFSAQRLWPGQEAQLTARRLVRLRLVTRRYRWGSFEGDIDIDIE